MDVTFVTSTWFVDCSFEASSLDLGRRHLVFLEPEVTIFGRALVLGEQGASVIHILIGILILASEKQA